MINGFRRRSTKSIRGGSPIPTSYGSDYKASTMPAIKFRVPGDPRPQQRAGLNRRGAGATFFDRNASRQYKDVVKQTIEKSIGLSGPPPVPAIASGPVSVSIVIVHRCPKSSFRKKTPAPRRWRALTPDIDNVTKSIFDGCTGYLWRDDRQVVKLDVEQYTGAQDEQPHVLVEVDSL